MERNKGGILGFGILGSRKEQQKKPSPKIPEKTREERNAHRQNLIGAIDVVLDDMNTLNQSLTHLYNTNRKEWHLKEGHIDSTVRRVQEELRIRREELQVMRETLWGEME